MTALSDTWIENRTEDVPGWRYTVTPFRRAEGSNPYQVFERPHGVAGHTAMEFEAKAFVNRVTPLNFDEDEKMRLFFSHGTERYIPQSFREQKGDNRADMAIGSAHTGRKNAEHYTALVIEANPDVTACLVCVGVVEMELAFPTSAIAAHGLKVGDRFLWLPSNDGSADSSSIAPYAETANQERQWDFALLRDLGEAANHPSASGGDKSDGR